MSSATDGTMGPDGWQVRKLSPALGAEITGADLRDQSEVTVEGLKALLLEYLVLFFPDQKLTIDEHVSLGRCFGELEGHPHLKNPYTPHDELFELAVFTAVSHG